MVHLPVKNLVQEVVSWKGGALFLEQHMRPKITGTIVLFCLLFMLEIMCICSLAAM